MEFILDRYNYWIVIILMMLGLYVVFARGNLVKKIVGLNIFQTSVFIFYITVGKIAGGTAPIYKGGELDYGHGDDHGGHHGDEHGAHDKAHGVEHEAGKHEQSGLHHAEVTNDLSAHDHPEVDLSQAKEGLLSDRLRESGGLHAEVERHADGHANVLNGGDHSDDAKHEGGIEITPEPHGAYGDTAHADATHADVAHADGAQALGDGGHHVAEIIYTNPLPHVLILTAIVVGVATTAVGLALAVRIREAYGTIEEDELEAADDVAEFGAESKLVRGAAS